MSLTIHRRISVGAVAYVVPDADAERSNAAAVVIEFGGIRFLTNGDTPTALFGTLANTGTIIRLNTPAAVRNFQAIRIENIDAIITIDFYSTRDVRLVLGG